MEATAQSVGVVAESERAQRYVPPSLRRKMEEAGGRGGGGGGGRGGGGGADGGGGGGAEEVGDARRQLSDLQVKEVLEDVSLLLRASSSLDFSSLHLSAAPEPLSPEGGGEGQVATTCYRLTVPLVTNAPLNNPPNQEVQALLSWFASATEGDGEAALEFGAALSKEQRSNLHVAAKTLGLGAISKGFKDERALMVLSAAGVALKQPHVTLSPQQRREADQIWAWVKTEGEDSGLQDLSRNEIQQMVAGGSLLPEIEQLVTRHEEADRLCVAAEHGDATLVRQILQSDKDLLHVTGKTRDLLPLHVACLAAGSAECSAAHMVALLLREGARVNDLDAHGRSALTLCRQDGTTAGVKAVLEVLEQHGGREVGGQRNKGREPPEHHSTPTSSWRDSRPSPMRTGGAADGGLPSPNRCISPSSRWC